MTEDQDWKPGMSMEELEKRAIARTLEYFSGNKALAARALGISERTLRNRVYRFNLHSFKKPSGRPRKAG
jgi:DNA-binding NtrC family response regulator